MFQRQKMLSSFHECHRAEVTEMDFPPECLFNSQPQLLHWGELCRGPTPLLCSLNRTSGDSTTAAAGRGKNNVVPKKEKKNYLLKGQ